MLFRVLQTRRASADGVTVDLFLRGRIYDRPEAFVRAWPSGTYELVKALPGPAENKSAGGGAGPEEGQGTSSTVEQPTPPAGLSKGELRKWRKQNGGA